MTRFSPPTFTLRPLAFGLLALVACDPNGDKVPLDTVDFEDSGTADSAETGETGDTAPADADGDGFVADIDCDDGNVAIHPDADETCDGIDNNCNGETDEGVTLALYADADGDGFGDSDTPIAACEVGPGVVADAADCDDSNPANSPGATEICDGRDNDCDGENDEDLRTVFYADADADGFGDINAPLSACEVPDGYAANYTDCDDTDVGTYPGSVEVCDAVDNNCDGQTDEDVTTAYYADADADGFGDPTAEVQECEAPAGFSADNTDCDDTAYDRYPGAPEVCDERDNSCDGIVDEGVTTAYFADLDGDGFGNPATGSEACTAPAGTVLDGTDCDDADATTYVGALEVCDERDNNCDGTADEGVTTAFFSDLDGDGFGDASAEVQACVAPAETVTDATDCDDTNGYSYPAAPEVCDGEQNDCTASWTSDAGLATWFGIDGSFDDVSSALGAGTLAAPATFYSGESGTLALCDGTWYVHTSFFLTDASTITGFGNPVLSGGNTGTVVTAEASAMLLSNVTIEAGLATTLLATGRGTAGGGVLCKDGTITLDSVVVRTSVAAYGGGVATDNCDIAATNSTFEQNESSEGGGGIFHSLGSFAVTGSQFEGNLASDGGAIDILAGSIDISDTTFDGNLAFESGGAISAKNCSGTLTDLTFTQNEAGEIGGAAQLSRCDSTLAGWSVSENQSGFGGGLAVERGTVDIAESTFTLNSASRTGGALYGSFWSGTVLDVVLEFNGATRNGGAIALESSTLDISASLFDGNSATLAGGGLYADDSTITLADSDFFTNEAATTGGGMQLEASTATLTGLDVYANTAQDYAGLAVTDASGIVAIANSTIRENVAQSNGGGMGQQNSNSTLTDCIFSGNVASNGHSGGLAVHAGSTTLQDVGFESNVADKRAGGIYHDDDATIGATSCDFTGNTPDDLHSEVSGAQSGLGLGVDFSCDTTSGCVF